MFIIITSSSIAIVITISVWISTKIDNDFYCLFLEQPLRNINKVLVENIQKYRGIYWVKEICDGPKIMKRHGILQSHCLAMSCPFLLWWLWNYISINITIVILTVTMNVTIVKFHTLNIGQRNSILIKRRYWSPQEESLLIRPCFNISGCFHLKIVEKLSILFYRVKYVSQSNAIDEGDTSWCAIVIFGSWKTKVNKF